MVNFLSTKYDLSPAVVISDFVNQPQAAPQHNADIEGSYKAEASKAQSQLAIATQRAAALFALEKNLLQATFDELQKQIEQTNDAQQSSEYKFLPEYYRREFVEPLEKLQIELREKLEKAKVKQVQAQQRFEALRQQATQPIMEQLQKSNKSYAKLYKSLDTTKFCEAVNKLNIGPIADGGVLRQAMSGNDAIPNNTVEFLRELYREAQDSRPVLHNVLRHLQKRCQDKGVTVEIEMGALKAIERAIEKSVEEYDGDFSRLVDLVRGSVVCNAVDDATQVIKTLHELVSEKRHDSSQRLSQQQQSQRESSSSCFLFKAPEELEPLPSIAILRVKNRLRSDFAAAAESGGYRDALINVQINGNHVCELQVHLNGFLKVKAGGGHKTYTVARSLHLLDPELSQVRVSASNSDAVGIGENTVRQELSDALKRVIAGTCQGLYLNHFKFTLAECQALKDALQAPACNVRDIAMPNCGLNKHRSEVLCQGVQGSLGEFLTVNLFNNRGITGECVGLFISDELRSMSVRRCRLGPLDAQAITKTFSLRKPWNMTEFNITGNDLGLDESKGLAKAVGDIAGMKSHAISNHVQADEELQDMLLFALSSRALDAVRAICQQGARPFERTTQQSPFELCVSLDFVEGFDAMIGAHADPTLNLASLDDSNMPGSWREMLYEGLERTFSSQGCCVNRLIAQGKSRTIEHVRIIQMMGRATLQLTDMDLRGSEFTAEEEQILGPSLAELKALTSLNLDSGHLGVSGTKALAPSLASLKALTSLNLENNSIGQGGAKALALPLAELRALTDLNLKRNIIGAGGADAIAPALAELKKLTLLNLCDNNMGTEGAEALAHSLAELTALTSLNLQENHMGTDGAKALAPSLAEMKSLTSLNLAKNAIGAIGAKAIAPSLARLKSLTTLNLEWNSIGAQGAKAFATSLAELNALTTLELGNNRIGTEGIKALAPSLTELKALRLLSLEGNDIPNDVKVQLEKEWAFIDKLYF